MKVLTWIGRWADTISYALIGAGLIDYVGERWAEKTSQMVETFCGASPVGPMTLFLASFLVLMAAHRFCGTRFRQFKHFAQYPPLPTAVLFAFAIAPLLPRIPQGKLAAFPLSWNASAMVAASFAAAWSITTGFRAIKGRLVIDLSNPVTGLSEPTEKENLKDHRLKEWLKREQPIDCESHDLFGIAPLAERLLERLKRGENTIALQGRFGSGKSSVAAIARNLSRITGEPLVFVSVSCWGFDDAAKAQEAILNALIQEMSKEVDTFAVQGIPKDYLDAIGENVGWLRSIAHLGQASRNPLQQLQRLSPLLAAIGHKAVIFIEDVDRSTTSFDISQIQALLVRFRDVKGLSFVLSISPTQMVDFSRLCEFIEVIPDLEPEQSLPIIHLVREILLREYPVGVLLDKLEPLQGDDEGYSPLYEHLDYYWPWALSLSDLLRTPRSLKHALRRVVESWPAVSGELKIDDLIGMSALRIGAPEAFEFFLRRRNRFAAAAKPKTPNLRDDARVPFREELTKEWNDICQKGDFDVRAAARVMFKIAPQSGAITGEGDAHSHSHQSMQSPRRGKTYARRLLTESTEPREPRDQTILSLLTKAENQTSSLGELAELITDSKSASAAFEEFAPATNFKAHLPLLSEVYKVIRVRHGARLIREEHPGFFPSWRLVGSYDRPENFEPWLINELEKCIPDNLHLLNEIYYFWLGTDKHGIEERRKSRQAIYEKLKRLWPVLPAEKVAMGFDPLFPYVLFHLVFTSDYERPDTVPVGKAEDWAWIGPVLIDAMRQLPNAMIPQILIAVNSASSRGFDTPRYEFDDRVLDLWFGQQSGELLNYVSTRFTVPVDLTAQTQYLLNLAIEKSKERLKKS